MVMRMFLDGFCNKVCVASTCSTSDVPIPNAKAPNVDGAASRDSINPPACLRRSGTPVPVR